MLPHDAELLLHEVQLPGLPHVVCLARPVLLERPLLAVQQFLKKQVTGDPGGSLSLDMYTTYNTTATTDNPPFCTELERHQSPWREQMHKTKSNQI